MTYKDNRRNPDKPEHADSAQILIRFLVDSKSKHLQNTFDRPHIFGHILNQTVMEPVFQMSHPALFTSTIIKNFFRNFQLAHQKNVARC